MSHKFTEQELEEILGKALFVQEEPREALNRKILERAKETKSMNKNIRRMAATAAAGLLILAGVSVSVYAGVKFLPPQEIAENIGYTTGDSMRAAFEGENAVFVNQAMSYAGGTVTFLGIAQGSSGGEFMQEADMKPDKSYIVLAFEGYENPNTIQVSPFIAGLAAWQYNIYTIGDNNGYTAITKDDIYYRVIGCGNLEIFADRGVYLGISKDILDSFEVNEDTGAIQAKADYTGDTVLFSVPFDASRADRKAADAVIEEIRRSFEEGGSKTDSGEDVESPLGKWTPQRVLEEGILLEETVSVVEVDSRGRINIPAWSIKDGVSGGGGFITYDGTFTDDKPGMSDCMFIMTGGDVLYIQTYTLNQDGTVTIAIYKVKHEE